MRFAARQFWKLLSSQLVSERNPSVTLVAVKLSTVHSVKMFPVAVRPTAAPSSKKPRAFEPPPTAILFLATQLSSVQRMALFKLKQRRSNCPVLSSTWRLVNWHFTTSVILTMASVAVTTEEPFVLIKQSVTSISEHSDKVSTLSAAATVLQTNNEQLLMEDSVIGAAAVPTNSMPRIWQPRVVMPFNEMLVLPEATETPV